jgi:hypothetical protein
MRKMIWIWNITLGNGTILHIWDSYGVYHGFLVVVIHGASLILS